MKKLLCLLALCALAFVGCASARQDAQTAPFDYQAEDVLIDAGDHQIPATVTIPVGAKGQKFPAVVMLHGNGSNRHEAGNAYDYATVEMAKAGIASIRFDYLGNGDSKGDYIDYTYDQGIEDAMTCYNYIIRQAGIDKKRVGIMGWSQGGRLTLLAAARSKVFKSALTWAGAYGNKDLAAEYEIAKKNGYYEVTYDWRAPLKQSPAYYEVAMGIDYPAEAARVPTPYMLIQGTKDTSVVPETATTIQKALVHSPDAEISWVEGAGHTFGVFSGDDTQLRDITARTIAWFEKTL